MFNPDGATIRTFYGAKGQGMTPAFDVWSLDGRLLTPARGKSAAAPDYVFFKGDSAIATSFAVSRDAHLLAWGGGVPYGDYHNVPLIGPQNDPRIVVWRVGEAKPAYTLSGHGDNVDDLAFNPEGTLLASVSHDQTVRVWRLSN